MKCPNCQQKVKAGVKECPTCEELFELPDSVERDTGIAEVSPAKGNPHSEQVAAFPPSAPQATTEAGDGPANGVSDRERRLQSALELVEKKHADGFKLFALVGYPASGKTEYLKALYRVLRPQGFFSPQLELLLDENVTGRTEFPPIGYEITKKRSALGLKEHKWLFVDAGGDLFSALSEFQRDRVLNIPQDRIARALSYLGKCSGLIFFVHPARGMMMERSGFHASQSDAEKEQEELIRSQHQELVLFQHVLLFVRAMQHLDGGVEQLLEDAKSSSITEALQKHDSDLGSTSIPVAIVFTKADKFADEGAFEIAPGQYMDPRQPAFRSMVFMTRYLKPLFGAMRDGAKIWRADFARSFIALTHLRDGRPEEYHQIKAPPKNSAFSADRGPLLSVGILQPLEFLLRMQPTRRRFLMWPMSTRWALRLHSWLNRRQRSKVPAMNSRWRWNEIGHSLPISGRTRWAALGLVLGALALALTLSLSSLLPLTRAKPSDRNVDLRAVQILPQERGDLASPSWDARLTVPEASTLGRFPADDAFKSALGALRSGEFEYAATRLDEVLQVLDADDSDGWHAQRAAANAGMAIALARPPAPSCEEALWHAKRGVREQRRASGTGSATKWIPLTLVWLYVECDESYPTRYREWLANRFGETSARSFITDEYPEATRQGTLRGFRKQLDSCLAMNDREGARCWALTNLNQIYHGTNPGSHDPHVLFAVATLLADGAELDQAQSFLARAVTSLEEPSLTAAREYKALVDMAQLQAALDEGDSELNRVVQEWTAAFRKDPQWLAGAEARLADQHERLRPLLGYWLAEARSKSLDQHKNALDEAVEAEDWSRVEALRKFRPDYLGDDWTRYSAATWSRLTNPHWARLFEYLSFWIVFAALTLWAYHLWLAYKIYTVPGYSTEYQYRRNLHRQVSTEESIYSFEEREVGGARSKAAEPGADTRRGESGT